MGNKKSSKN